MEATSDAAKDLATADQPPAVPINQLCRVGLRAGLVVLCISPLVMTAMPPLVVMWLGLQWDVSVLWVTGGQIGLAGMVIGICGVGLIRVLCSEGAEWGAGRACGGIAAASGSVIVACLPWLRLLALLSLPRQY